jgi:hypothetical protein
MRFFTFMRQIERSASLLVSSLAPKQSKRRISSLSIWSAVAVSACSLVTI